MNTIAGNTIAGDADTLVRGRFGYKPYDYAVLVET